MWLFLLLLSSQTSVDNNKDILVPVPKGLRPHPIKWLCPRPQKTASPELAKQRQKIVLNAMVKYGYISESDKSDILNQASTPTTSTNTTSPVQTDTNTSTVEPANEE